MAGTNIRDMHAPRGEDRRTGDRRVAQTPFAGAERRKGERRAGTDRRARG